MKHFKELKRRSYNTFFCWVPGHMDIPGNEKADKSAKCALNLLHHQIKFTDVKYRIKRFILNKWKKSLDIEYNNKVLMLNYDLTSELSLKN